MILRGSININHIKAFLEWKTHKIVGYTLLVELVVIFPHTQQDIYNLLQLCLLGIYINGNSCFREIFFAVIDPISFLENTIYVRFVFLTVSFSNLTWKHNCESTLNIKTDIWHFSSNNLVENLISFSLRLCAMALI